MGTRGLIGFKVDGQYKGTYNHFDSYPACLGSGVVDFLLDLEPEGLDILKKRVRALTWVDEQDTPPIDLQQRYKKYSDTGVSGKTLCEWYCLLRELQGADMLLPIHTGKVEHLIDNTDFAKDSLFCEWAYFINLDDNTLETWEGFQKEPWTGNPFGEEPQKSAYNSYYPIARIASVPIDKLHVDYMDEIEKLVNGEDCDDA